MKGLAIAVGVFLVLAGVALAAYIGIYLCLVRGIILCVNGVTADPVNAALIAWGVVRILLTSLGSLVGWIVAGAGIAAIATSSDV